MSTNDNNTVTPFDFVGQQVRTVMRKGCPGFFITDVCRVLEIGNPSDAARRLDDDEKGVDSIDTLGGAQQMVIVNEPGLYSLIMTSRKPEAKAFKRWVFETVLPALRRDGMYVVGEEKVLAGEMSEDELLLKAMTALQAKVERLRVEKDVLSATVVIMAPKVALVNATFAQGCEIG